MSIISIFEPLAEQAIASLPSDIQALIAALPKSAQPAASPVGQASPANVQTAVLANLAKAIPAITSTLFSTITKQIGNAVAEAATAFVANGSGGSVAAYLVSAAGMSAIHNLVVQAFSSQGLAVNLIPPNSLMQMVTSGIEMYLAGVGAQAIVVS